MREICYGDSLRFIDLFAGIGGFRVGFCQAKYKCVFSCEIDSSCQEVYKDNFGEILFSDITEVNVESIPDNVVTVSSTLGWTSKNVARQSE